MPTNLFHNFAKQRVQLEIRNITVAEVVDEEGIENDGTLVFVDTVHRSSIHRVFHN